jgi:uncharacterized protein
MSCGELIAFYKSLGPNIFKKERLLYRIKHFYRSDPLAEQLKATFGEKTSLTPEHLRCLLLIVTRNVTTDSPGPISSAPVAIPLIRRPPGTGGSRWAITCPISAFS